MAAGSCTDTGTAACAGCVEGPASAAFNGAIGGGWVAVVGSVFIA